MQESKRVKTAECMKLLGFFNEIRRLTKEKSAKALAECMHDNSKLFPLLPSNPKIANEHLEFFLNKAWCFEFVSTFPQRKTLGYAWVITDYSVVIITAIHIPEELDREIVYKHFVQAIISWPFTTAVAIDGSFPPIADKSFLAITAAKDASLLTGCGFTNGSKDIRPDDRISQVLILDKSNFKREHSKLALDAKIKHELGKGELERASNLLMTQTHWGVKTTPSVLKIYDEHSTSYVLERNKESGAEVIGYGRIVTDGVQLITILDFVIDESLRKQGYGRYLLDAMLSDPKTAHIPCWRITSSLAAGFYEKMGFKPTNLPELSFGQKLCYLTLRPKSGIPIISLRTYWERTGMFTPVSTNFGKVEEEEVETGIRNQL